MAAGLFLNAAERARMQAFPAEIGREDLAAYFTLTDFQHAQPISKLWGGGTLSSSDGQRFPVTGKSSVARAIPRYFGFGRGVTFYTWVASEFSQYGIRVIPSTVRDATYLLDAILDAARGADAVELVEFVAFGLEHQLHLLGRTVKGARPIGVTA